MQQKQTITQQPTCIITIDAQTSFETILTQALDETFTALGIKQQVYSQLKTKYQILPWQTAENIDALTAALKDMFGDASLLVELKIMSQLHSKTPKTKFNLNADEELTLCGYLNNLKASFS
jgi:hypothetical protein